MVASSVLLCCDFYICLLLLQSSSSSILSKLAKYSFGLFLEITYEFQLVQLTILNFREY